MIVGGVVAGVLGCVALVLGIVFLTRKDPRVRVPARAPGTSWDPARGTRYHVEFVTPDGRYVRTTVGRMSTTHAALGFSGYVWADPANPFDARLGGEPSPTRLAGMIALGCSIALFVAAGVLVFLGVLDSAMASFPAVPTPT